MLRAERGLAHPRRRPAHRGDHQQLPPHQLQHRPHPARVARRGGPGHVRADHRGRPGEPRRTGGARERARPALQSRDPAARDPPGQRDPGRLGHRRFPRAVRTRPRGDVAPRDGGGHRDARGPRRPRHPLHDPGAAPGGARPSPRPGLDRRARRPHRPEPPLPLPAAGRGGDHAVFLRQPDRARGRVRGAAQQRRGVREPAHGRVSGGPEGAADRPHRHGRRVVRPPPPLRRHGPRPRPAAHRRGRDRAAHQLRRISGAPPSGPRGGDPGADELVLPARGRAVARELRLPRRTGGLDPGVAAAAPRGARLAAGRARPGLRRAGGPGAAGSVGRPGGVHRRHPPPQPRGPGRVLRRPRPGGPAARRASPGAPPPRDAAAGAVDVHVVRVVLRRALRDRDRPGHRARRAGDPAGPELRVPARGRFHRPAGRRQEQPPPLGRRGSDLRPGRPSIGGDAPPGGRAGARG